MVTAEDVENAQQAWGDGIVAIASAHSSGLEYIETARNHIHSLYAYDIGPVLFKPTKCSIQQFRLTKSEAISYFISGENRECVEDKGFAIQPWTAVRFENACLILEEHRALAMGNYYFTDLDGNETKVEYTFGYKIVDGMIKIDLHHSSFPFSHDK